jgi:hypothetical protein
VIFGAVAGLLASSGHGVYVVALLAVLLPVLVWRRPQLGPLIILLCGLLVEQFPLDLVSGDNVKNVPITNAIPLYQGIGPVHVEPIDLLLLSIALVYLLKTRGSGTHLRPRGPLALSVLAVAGSIIFGEILGIAHHGDVRESLQECRPMIYFASAYGLTAVMIRTRSAIHMLAWALVAAEAFKSVQGIAVFLSTRNFNPEPQNILGHEESMFFSLFLLMVAALWLFEIKGLLRKVATWLVPLVLFTDMINDRRVAWLILPAGLVVMGAIGYRALPHRRRRLLWIAGVAAVATAIYLPAFWNSQGTLGKPASSIKSELGTPDERDALSDDYRIQENANLEFNIRQDGLIGEGYGREIDYALPMPGLVVAQDASILYIPHNGILYVLMRLGILGGLAFWMMLASAIITSSRLALVRDREMAAIGAIAAAMAVGWAFMAAEDMGFVFDRVTLVMGCVLGLTEAARHISASGVRRERVAARPKAEEGEIYERPVPVTAGVA